MPSAWRRLVVCGAPDCSVRCGPAGPAVEGEDAGGTLLEGLVAAGGDAVTGGAGAPHGHTSSRTARHNSFFAGVNPYLESFTGVNYLPNSRSVQEIRRG